MSESRPDAAPPSDSALTPPVMAVVTEAALISDDFEAFVESATSGAVVTFRGVIRNHDHGAAVSSLEYSSHPEAERFLRECCERVAASSGLRVAAGHRVGALQIGDVALVASVAAAHRAEAFAACEELVELIKTSVPIWKRQHLADGVTEWVGI